VAVTAEGGGSAQAGAGFPGVVVAPARPDIRPGHEGDVIFEVRQLSDGGRALPVFTTVSRLVAVLGPEQPWVAIPLRNVEAIVGGAGVDRVVVDPQADPNAWRWRASDLEALERRQ
jgi:SseB protein N-terminal domain